MDQNTENQNLHPEITEHIFANSPTMLALCLTVMGLIKIYTALKRVTTLTDDFLVICLVSFLLATVFSYLSLRAAERKRKIKLARLADSMFLTGLCSATGVAIFVVYSLAG
jgi:hypothetical protein